MNKMVINHLEKLFVTSDASTIVTEMDVYHPAAKLLVMAAKAQAGEVGDGTNLVRQPCILKLLCGIRVPQQDDCVTKCSCSSVYGIVDLCHQIHN
jgi:hypothetical protein